jgi:hypothetical protein
LILFFIFVELSIFAGIIYPEPDIEEDHQAEQGKLDKGKDPKDADGWLLGRKVGAHHEGAVEAVGYPTDASQEEHHPEDLQSSQGRFLGDKDGPFILDNIHNHPPCEIYKDKTDDKSDLDGKRIIHINGDPQNSHFQKGYDAGKDIKGVSFHRLNVQNIVHAVIKTLLN